MFNPALAVPEQRIDVIRLDGLLISFVVLIFPRHIIRLLLGAILVIPQRGKGLERHLKIAVLRLVDRLCVHGHLGSVLVTAQAFKLFRRLGVFSVVQQLRGLFVGLLLTVSAGGHHQRHRRQQHRRQRRLHALLHENPTPLVLLNLILLFAVTRF